MATYQVQSRDGKYVVAVLNDAGEVADISPPFDEKEPAKELRDKAEKANVARLADIPAEKPKPVTEESKPAPAKAPVPEAAKPAAKPEAKPKTAPATSHPIAHKRK